MTKKMRNLLFILGAGFVIAGAILKYKQIEGSYILIMFGFLVGQTGYMVELKAVKKENQNLKATIVKLTNQRSA